MTGKGTLQVDAVTPFGTMEMIQVAEFPVFSFPLLIFPAKEHPSMQENQENLRENYDLLSNKVSYRHGEIFYQRQKMLLFSLE